MHRTLFALASAAIAGCALSAPADLSPDTDSTLPSIDAGGGSATPAHGNHATPSDAGLPSDGSGDGGTTKLALDAGPPTPAPTQGEILVSEVMYDPSGPEPKDEWFEIYNAASSARALGGLTIVDGSARTHVIAGDLTIAPGAYVVFARDKVTATTYSVPVGAIVYEYGTGLGDSAGILLVNGATGVVSITDGSTTIATAPYGGWFSSAAGRSVQLATLTYAASLSKANWCLSANAWTSGSDKGTPGGPNDCP